MSDVKIYLCLDAKTWKLLSGCNRYKPVNKYIKISNNKLLASTFNWNTHILLYFFILLTAKHSTYSVLIVLDILTYSIERLEVRCCSFLLTRRSTYYCKRSCCFKTNRQIYISSIMLHTSYQQKCHKHKDAYGKKRL